MLPLRAPKQESDPQPGGGVAPSPHHCDPMAVLRMLVSSPAKEAQQQQLQHLHRGSSATRLPGHPAEAQAVLGGKASCRRKFVLNVALMDEQGRPVEKDLSVTASLTYAHDHSPVKVEEGQTMVEPPLFTTFNGVEFPAHLRPSQMIGGKASFKLALSVLSSKCDNRLFSVRFTATGPAGQSTEDTDNVRVLPGYSEAIRSISRKRSRASLVAWGGSPPAAVPLLAAPALRHSPLALALRPPLLAEGSACYSPQSPGVYQPAPSMSLEGSPSLSTGADVSNHTGRPGNSPEVSTAILPQQQRPQQQQQQVPRGAQLKHIQHLLQEHCMSPAASHSSPPAPRPSPLSRGTSSSSSWQHQDHLPPVRHLLLPGALSTQPQGQAPHEPEGPCLLPLQPFPTLDTGACLQRPDGARPYLTHQQANRDQQHALEQALGASAASPSSGAPPARPREGSQRAGKPALQLCSQLSNPVAAGGAGMLLGAEASEGRMPPALASSPLSTPLDAPVVCPPPSFMSPFHLSPTVGAPQDPQRSLCSDSTRSDAAKGSLGAPASSLFGGAPASNLSAGSQEETPGAPGVSSSTGLSGALQGPPPPELCRRELSQGTPALPRGHANDVPLSLFGAPGAQAAPALQSGGPGPSTGFARRATSIQYRLVKLLPPGRLSLQRPGPGLKPEQPGEPEGGAPAAGEGNQSLNLDPVQEHTGLALRSGAGAATPAPGVARAEGLPSQGGLCKRLKGGAPRIVLPPRIFAHAHAHAPRGCSRMGTPAAMGPCLSPLKFSPHFRASPLYCSPSHLSPHMLSPLGRVLMHFAPTPSPKGPGSSRGPCSPKVTEQGQGLDEPPGGSPNMVTGMGGGCKGLSGPAEGAFLSDLQAMPQAVAEGTH